ncbi:hypothetical protein PR048_032249 [Dryococelus australis]|uniref:Uncharacterized protein n=1 Tax=Dryococelus australis TaxID=614101 RepID=A0ABQ9G1P1_9NEOP|nr:hypothetical protein PR048_032249 [Dryococelus australis]
MKGRGETGDPREKKPPTSSIVRTLFTHAKIRERLRRESNPAAFSLQSQRWQFCVAVVQFQADSSGKRTSIIFHNNQRQKETHKVFSRHYRLFTIWAALNIDVLRADEGEKRGEYGAAPERKKGRKREIPEKTHRPVASSGVIPAWEVPGAIPPGIEPGLPGWEVSSLTTVLPRPQLILGKTNLARGDVLKSRS